MISSVRLAPALSLWCIRVRKEEAERDDAAKREKGNYVSHKFRRYRGRLGDGLYKEILFTDKSRPRSGSWRACFLFLFFFLSFSKALLLTGFPRNCLLSGRLIWFKKKRSELMSHVKTALPTRLQSIRCASFSSTADTVITSKKGGLICNRTASQWFSSALLQMFIWGVSSFDHPEHSTLPQWRETDVKM